MLLSLDATLATILPVVVSRVEGVRAGALSCPLPAWPYLAKVKGGFRWLARPELPVELELQPGAK